MLYMVANRQSAYRVYIEDYIFILDVVYSRINYLCKHRRVKWSGGFVGGVDVMLNQGERPT